MKIFNSILILLLLSISSGCNSQSSNIEIENHEQFIALSSKPLYQKYGQVASVKVVYDTKNSKMHFIPSNVYEYHYEYCMARLHFLGDLSQFNQLSYSSKDSRRFLLANINYFQAIDKYAIELAPSDRMNMAQLKLIFEQLSKQKFFKENLYIFQSTAHLKQIIPKNTDLPLLEPNEVYEGQVYQPISKQSAVGRIRIIENWEEEAHDVKPTDIIVLKDIPEVFPLVQGVVVTQFQTPLSHVTLLGQNRKIPICAYTKAFEIDFFEKMKGQVVEYQVLQDTFLIKPSTADLSQLWQKGKRVSLKKSNDIDSLVPIEYLRGKHSSEVGNKAANFAELRSYSEKIPFRTPEAAFAIPFHFYESHIRKAHIQEMIDDLLEKENRDRSPYDLRKELETIQESILTMSLDEEFLRDLKKMILRNPEFQRLRFRSSTNAEDMKGFSGAGIYTSKTGELGNSDKPVEEAIIAVWASLWSYNAFMEREAFNINHSTVAMGVLVHRSFPDEAVNGVAITTNLYRDDYLGFVVNAQLGDQSVVQPSGEIRCDEFICYPDETSSMYGKQEVGIDIINYSSLNNGELVMTNKEIQDLANVLERIKQKYVRHHYTKATYFNFGLDIEFKLEKDTRRLYIKQMRVYNN